MHKRIGIKYILNTLAAACLLLGCTKESPTEPDTPPVAGMVWRVIRQPWDFTGHYGLRAVVWSGSQFVAMGGDTLIYTSPDGLAWTGHLRPDHVSFTFTMLRDLAYGGGLYVAVGERNTVLTSVDGSTWVRQLGDLSELTNNMYTFVEWNGTIFVAGGWYEDVGGNPFHDSHKLNYSTDGAYWQYGDIPDAYLSRPMNGAAWNGSLWVLTSSEGITMTSPDAQSWTPRATNNSTNMEQVVWADTVFLEYPRDFGSSGSELGKVNASLDGITWAKKPMNLDMVGTVLYMGTMFVAASADSIFTSTDGLNWTFRQKLPLNMVHLTVYGIAWSGARFVAVGEGGFIAVSP